MQNTTREALLLIAVMLDPTSVILDLRRNFIGGSIRSTKWDCTLKGEPPNHHKVERLNGEQSKLRGCSTVAHIVQYQEALKRNIAISLKSDGQENASETSLPSNCCGETTSGSSPVPRENFNCSRMCCF